MKAKKVLKQIAKIEALMSKVTKRSSLHIRNLLRDAKAAVIRAKEAVQASSGTAKNTPAKSAQHPPKPTSEPAKRKTKTSAAGRRATAEPTKKRSAAKRAAAKKTAVKKVATKKATPVKAAKAPAPEVAKAPAKKAPDEGGEGTRRKSGEERPGEEGCGESSSQEDCESGSGGEEASPSEGRDHGCGDARTGYAGSSRSEASGHHCRDAGTGRVGSTYPVGVFIPGDGCSWETSRHLECPPRQVATASRSLGFRYSAGLQRWCHW